MSGPRGRAMSTGEKLDTKVLGRLIGFVMKRYRFQIILVTLCIILAAWVQVQGSLFQRTLIDGYITPMVESGSNDFGPLAARLLQMAMIYGCGILANFIHQRTMIRVTQGTIEEIREMLFEHMERLPIKYFDTHPHGAISIPLTLLAITMVFILQYVLRKIMRQSGRYFMRQQNDLGKENGYIEEMMEGAKVVKVFNYESKAITHFNELNNNLRDSANNANKYANITGPVTNNIGNISYVLTAVIGSILVLGGFTKLTLGQLASFLALNKSFNMPFSQVAQQMNSVIMAMAGARRIFALLDEEPEIDEGQVTLVNAKIYPDGTIVESDYETSQWAWKHPHPDGTVELVPLKGDVRFHDVQFSYVPDKQVLYDINLYAEPGQKLAFVGATGAGKTTMINLINRFYDVPSGSITYDGIDVKLIKKNDLRKSLGIVLQDTHLFTGTIEENIKYARPEATHEEVVDAAKFANADSFINHLENGYETKLSGDGSSLSQGQRQLLAIARAALANPPVLILDEATSSIDSRTEKLVQNGLDNLMRHRTTFVIAHRLSTIKNSHAIMVMDHGRIIERGNHKSLLEKKGIYYRLYTGDLEID